MELLINMNKKYLILFLFILIFNCKIFPQITNHSYEDVLTIVFANINFEGIVTGYKYGNTRVNYFGRAQVELLKYNPESKSNDEVILGKTKIFIQ